MSNQEVTCRIHLGAEETDAVLQLNTRLTAEARKLFQTAVLVGALLLFSLAMALYPQSLFWIPLPLSLLLALLGVRAGAFQRALIKASTKKEIGSERDYRFSREGVDITSDLGTAHNPWTTFTGRGELGHYLYLMRRDRNLVLIDKNQLSEEEAEILAQLIRVIPPEAPAETGRTSPLRKLLILVTAVVVLLSLGHLGVHSFYPLPQDCIFRLWFTRTLPIVLRLTLLVLDLLWVLVLSRRLNAALHRSLFSRFALWLVVILTACALALGSFLSFMSFDTEHHNANGTVTLEHGVWLDRSTYALYRPENLLALRYLRDADGPDDTDPNVTQEDYLNQKEQEYLEHSQDREQRIDEGYQAIYDAFLSSGSSGYRKDYDAKGNSYIVVYEDDSCIRYLKYDRAVDEGASAQYMYFQCEKDANGCWSTMDAEILETYHYHYGSKKAEQVS